MSDDFVYTIATCSCTSQLADRIAQQSARVGIIGLGYVGLPLVKTYLTAGFSVIGFDTDADKVDLLLRSESYIGHISDTVVAGWLQTGRFCATSNLAELAEPDVILICVPTPLTESRDPDLQYVEATARSISKVLRRGQLVILESTTYPGTTRDVVTPLLAESGLVAGHDFFVAFSPEREDPGNANFTAGTIPKVVGGFDAKSLELATAFYSQGISSVVPVSSCEVTEACKILENTYRSVNIAMINELKMLFERLGIDMWEVIEAAKTKPFGFQAFYPGPGWAGTAFPSIRSICRGSRENMISMPSSSSWPDSSIRKCRSTSWTEWRRRLKVSRNPSAAARSASWAWPISATSTIRGKARLFD